jgi:glycosyltransferase involved in cell wall biosynthesis
MPKRILYIHASAGLGGAPLSLLYLIEQLDRRLHEPEVLFIGVPREEVDLFRHRGIPVYFRSDITTYPHGRGAFLSLRSLRPWEVVTRAAQALPSALRVRAFLRDHAVDLVHLNSSILLPAGLGAAWAGLPVIWHIRESLNPGTLGLRRILIRALIDRCSSAIIAISRFDAAPWGKSPKIHVVYNFVDFGRFGRDLDGDAFRRSLGLPLGRPLVAMLGGIVQTKGADVCLEAAALVRERRPDALFVIAGTPPTVSESPSAIKRTLRRCIEGVGIVPSMQRRVRALMQRHRLADTVRFVGMRSDVPEMLAASAVLVWPATVSHFARPIIEAGAAGLPVVASDFPSSRELVRHGETGLLVPPSDPAALAEAVLRCLEHPDEARKMGDAGHALARERYDARRNARAIMDIYENVLPADRTAVETG